MDSKDEIRSWSRELVAALSLACALALGTAPAEARGCRRDADCDGLNNKEERTYGTSRHDADTDHDGLSDFAEVRRLSSDPDDSDSDDDGVEDGDEVMDGTDPGSSDSDGDGSSDGDDDDPSDELKAKVVGPLDGVDAAANTVTMYGCLTIDVSAAELDGFALSDLAPGNVIEIRLDASALPALKATRMERDDDDHDGVPDDHEDDDGHDGDSSDD